MKDLVRYAVSKKNPAIWAVGMGMITIAVVLVVAAMTFGVTDSVVASSGNQSVYYTVKGNLFAAAGLFGVVGIILVVSLLFNIIR